MTSAEQKTTPLMGQWALCKQQAKDAVLLFRLGDFYEAFHDDAEVVSKALDLTLTKRQDVPMCGIPWHTSEGYIDKLLSKGFSVAIAEQMEEASEKSKTLVERKVVKIVTPATAMQGSLIQDSTNSILACISKIGGAWGVTIVDVTTALLQAFTVQDDASLLQELSRLNPKEIITSKALATKEEGFFDQLTWILEVKKSVLENWLFDINTAQTVLQTHFQTTTLDAFGLTHEAAILSSTGALISYLKDTLLLSVHHLKSLDIIQNKAFMHLDKATYNNLDIFDVSSKAQGTKSLFDLMNETKTPMGARLLRNWLLNPLIKIDAIEKRQDAVQECIEAITNERINIESALHSLSQIRDLERLILRLQACHAGPRDILFLAQCCSFIKPIKEALLPTFHGHLHELIESLPQLDQLVQMAKETLVDEPPLRISDCGAIRDGINQDLDELRAIRHDTNSWLVAYQTRLREELGIKTLKVGYSRAFGFFIEVSRGQSDKMPSNFARRQTLTGSERYISEELKHYEDKALTAEKKIELLESAIFHDLKERLYPYAEKVLMSSRILAEVDLFLSLARLAIHRRHVRPKLEQEPVLEIVDGRHPIAEVLIKDHAYVPNDLVLSSSGPSLILITGPNMAGKSTYIRQAALLVIMAQIGSFIPAKSARIGIVDRVFSRVGASDDLSRGQSTFMVEMTETANILRHATASSLVLLDEIGRGTSTYDGISIAWSVIEHLSRSPLRNPRTLFATHYYELTALEQQSKWVKNMSVSVSEQPDTIRFLYKVIDGKTDRSYGIHVARLAGMPHEVILRAGELLEKLERRETTNIPPPAPLKTDLFGHMPQPQHRDTSPCYEFLKNLDLIKLTPLDCFVKLMKFKDSLK